jgi:hypothetical protein
MAKAKTPGGPRMMTAAMRAMDRVRAARAILQCYIDSIPDERADDRYVLWAARDALDDTCTLIDRVA